MATLAPAQLVFLANEWEKLYGSAVLSGIVGDLAHKLRGGYHISIQDQPSDNYSVIRSDDKAPPGNWPRDRASAIDMTMSTADIKKCHIRLREAWKDRANDVRMKYINAWNGWDGQGDAGRYDVVKGTIGTATADHKWHIHLEIRRRYVNDNKAMLAILSILKGETLEEYLGEDMPLSDADVKKIWDVDYLPSGDTTNPTWAAKTLIGYRLNTINDNVAKLATAVAKVTQDVAALRAASAGVDVDEVALGTAITSNVAFVDALATAVASKIQGGEDVATAVRSVLNEARIVVS